jgi:hypothetical protein
MFFFMRRGFHNKTTLVIHWRLVNSVDAHIASTIHLKLKLFVSIFRDLSDESGLNTGYAKIRQGHFWIFYPTTLLF